MIEHLKIGRAAYFYKRKKGFSNSALNKLFAVLRQHAQKPTKNLFSAVRTQVGEARYSAICFSFDRQASFLDKEAEAWERIYGFLLIVEKWLLFDDDLSKQQPVKVPAKFSTSLFFEPEHALELNEQVTVPNAGLRYHF